MVNNLFDRIRDVMTQQSTPGVVFAAFLGSWVTITGYLDVKSYWTGDLAPIVPVTELRCYL